MERRPDPEPLETDDVRIVAAGGVAWLVALAVLVVLRLAGVEVDGAPVRDWWLWMCASGAALGALGVRHCRRRRAALSR